eukprot:COSAG01_NODE_5903_length_3962_cov_9.509973_6_plen_82_part_00
MIDPIISPRTRREQVPFLSTHVIGDDLEIVSTLGEMLAPRICEERETVYTQGDVGQELYHLPGTIQYCDRNLESADIYLRF